MIDLTEDNIESVLNQEGLIALDFYGSWCNPCNQMLPIYNQINEEDNTVTFYKVDVDAQKNIVQTYAVRSIPTVIFIRNNEVIEKITGIETYDNVKNIIEKM